MSLLVTTCSLPAFKKQTEEKRGIWGVCAWPLGMPRGITMVYGNYSCGLELRTNQSLDTRKSKAGRFKGGGTQCNAEHKLLKKNIAAKASFYYYINIYWLALCSRIIGFQLQPAPERQICAQQF